VYDLNDIATSLTFVNFQVFRHLLSPFFLIEQVLCLSTSFHPATQNEPGDGHMPGKLQALLRLHEGIRSCGIAKPPAPPF
jgi:hypothetical protein